MDEVLQLYLLYISVLLTNYSPPHRQIIQRWAMIGIIPSFYRTTVKFLWLKVNTRSTKDSIGGGIRQPTKVSDTAIYVLSRFFGQWIFPPSLARTPLVDWFVTNKSVCFTVHFTVLSTVQLYFSYGTLAMLCRHIVRWKTKLTIRLLGSTSTSTRKEHTPFGRPPHLGMHSWIIWAISSSWFDSGPGRLTSTWRKVSDEKMNRIEL